MPRYVAFLRGINLGRRRLPMSELRAQFEALGFAKVETFIASGNVIFETKVRDTAKLEARSEMQLAENFGYTVDTFLRRDDEVIAALNYAAFPEGTPDGGGIYVTFLKQALDSLAAKKLTACRTEIDAFHVNGREIYWLCRTKSSDSKIWTSPEVKALKLPTGTMRNLTSLRKLVAKCFAGLPVYKLRHQISSISSGH